MKNIYKILLIICFINLMLTSCREKFDIDLKTDKNARIVVEGGITTEAKSHCIKLSKTGSYINGQGTGPVSGALVTISDGTITDTLTEISGTGRYYTRPNYQGIVGKTYTLKINAANIGNYTASSIIKYAFPVDSIEVLEVPEGELKQREKNEYHKNDSGKYYYVNVWAKEPPTVGDYYMWNVYINRDNDTDTLFKVPFVNDALVNGNDIPGMTLRIIRANPGDTISTPMFAITEEHYYFMQDFMLETAWNSGPFGGPPANIKGNVKNDNPNGLKGLGFFSAMDVTTAKKIIPITNK